MKTKRTEEAPPTPAERQRQRELAASCVRLAWQLAHKHARRCGLDEDATQEAVDKAEEALLRAARTYDPSRGAKFVSYAYGGINLTLRGLACNKVRDRERAERLGRPAVLSLSAMGRPDDDGADWDPAAPEPEESPVEAADRAAVLRKLLSKLKPAQRACLEMRYGRGMTFDEIGVRMGFSRTRAEQVASEAMAKLRRSVTLGALRRAAEHG